MNPPNAPFSMASWNSWLNLRWFTFTLIPAILSLSSTTDLEQIVHLKKITVFQPHWNKRRLVFEVRGHQFTPALALTVANRKIDQRRDLPSYEYIQNKQSTRNRSFLGVAHGTLFDHVWSMFWTMHKNESTKRWLSRVALCDQVPYIP